MTLLSYNGKLTDSCIDSPSLTPRYRVVSSNLAKTQSSEQISTEPPAEVYRPRTQLIVGIYVLHPIALLRMAGFFLAFRLQQRIGRFVFLYVAIFTLWAHPPLD